MFKKLLALWMTFALLLTACPAALAADGEDIRETNFFTDREHGSTDYADMVYETVDPAPMLEEAEAIRTLAASESNAAKVEERFTALTEEFEHMAGMYSLVNIQASQDVTDEEAASELETMTRTYNDIANALNVLVQDLLNSPCDAFLRERMTEEEIQDYLDYTPMTEEQKELDAQVTALVSEYSLAAYQTYTFEYEGVEYDEESVINAFLAGAVDDAAYDEILSGIAQARNAVLGDIYMQLVELRQEFARSYGYDNYADYAYSEVYQRDYTKEEIQTFSDAVKENIPAVCDALEIIVSAEADSAVYMGDYTGEDTLDRIETYIGRMSSELAEAYSFMREHHLYDIGVSDGKNGTGYTTMIYDYNEPFFFNTPTGQVYDFTTVVHEFGHYNEFYWGENDWDSAVKSIDLAEVHSQGLELLFSHWYPEIFGEEDGSAVFDYQLYNLISAIVQGCLHDELQTYIYTAEDLTLQKINEKYCELLHVYGLLSEDDTRTELYGWVDINHTFASPCYYISYAVSAAGAFAFWLESVEDYEAAVDHYLEFTALDAEYTFQESFAEVDMENPIAPDYVEQLASTLMENLNLEQRVAEAQAQIDAEVLLLDTAISDIPEDAWYAPYVGTMVLLGIVSAQENGTFGPMEPATLSDVVDAMNALGAGEEWSDDESGNDPITRLLFCQYLAEAMELDDPTGDPLFFDTDDPAVTALAELGIVTGYEDGSFCPDRILSRAELCALLFRMISVIATS